MSEVNNINSPIYYPVKNETIIKQENKVIEKKQEENINIENINTETQTDSTGTSSLPQENSVSVNFTA
ncbi:MAG: hypothetical protein OEZ22_00440 [Spirochaetia bacterium]|nr:hypothetical protein [Spirochaetia bacterium]